MITKEELIEHLKETNITGVELEDINMDFVNMLLNVYGICYDMIFSDLLESIDMLILAHSTTLNIEPAKHSILIAAYTKGQIDGMRTIKEVLEAARKHKENWTNARAEQESAPGSS